MGGGLCRGSDTVTDARDNVAVKNDLSKASLQDFQYEKTLGAGNFGEVHRVKHNGSGVAVAMKIVKRRGKSKRSEEKDRQESKVLESMNHPFIVHLYKTFRTEQEYFIVMELLSGGEVHQHLKKAGRFSHAHVKFYCSEVCLALEYLHKKNIIYRDLKPENLVINSDGHTVLTDMGLAKHVNIREGGRAFSFCGTPEYLSPEMIQNEGHNHGVDWWAFAVLIFEMLCGHPPFRGDSTDATYKLILAGKFDCPKHLEPGSVDIVTKLLVKQDKRAGKDDPKEVKNTKFFRGVDWVALIAKQVAPPKL